MRTLIWLAVAAFAAEASAQTPWTHWRMQANQAYYAQNYYAPGTAAYWGGYAGPYGYGPRYGGWYANEEFRREMRNRAWENSHALRGIQLEMELQGAMDRRALRR